MKVTCKVVKVSCWVDVDVVKVRCKIVKVGRGVVKLGYDGKLLGCEG